MQRILQNCEFKSTESGVYCKTRFYQTAVKNRGHYYVDYQYALRSSRG